MNNYATNRKPYVPVFPKECLPENPVRTRGLGYLKAALEVLGQPAGIDEGAVTLIRNVKGVRMPRAVVSVENNVIGFKVRFADSGEQELVFSMKPEEEQALTRAVVGRYNPDPEKLEFEYLQVINAAFIMEHGQLDESDYEKIFASQALMAMLRNTPDAHGKIFQGDTLQGSYYNGAHPFRNGVIIPRPMWAEEGDRRIHFCAKPYVPYLLKDGRLDTSGGPFFCAGKERFSFVGEEERLFWCFGHDGACAHGGIYFPCRSNRWELSGGWEG